jgi:hypothetical protein
MHRALIIGILLGFSLAASAGPGIRQGSWRPEPEKFILTPGDTATSARQRGIIRRHIDRMKERLERFVDKIKENRLVNAATPVVKTAVKAATPAVQRSLGRQTEGIRNSVENLGEKISEAVPAAK